MLDEQTKIKTRIFNLLQKAANDGCTEEEAMAFAEKAGELMDHYQLNITDIQILQTRCITDVYTLANAASRHQGCMAVAIARYCDCKVWSTAGQRFKKHVVGAKLHFFGLASDVEMAMFLMEIVDKAFYRAAKEFKKSDWWKDNVTNGYTKGLSAQAGFKNGFQSRLCSRFTDMKDTRDAEIQTQQEEMNDALSPERRERTARNLVLVKTNHVEDEFRKLNMRLTGGGSRHGGGDYSARGEGHSAGDRVGLYAGVRGQQKTLMIT